MADTTTQNPLENFEVNQQRKGEEKQWKEKETRENVEKSEIGQKLKELLWIENKDIYERILTLLSKYEWNASDENLKKEIEAVFTSKEIATQLWLSLNEAEKSEVINIIQADLFSKKGENKKDNKDTNENTNKNTSENLWELSSFPLLQRLENEWFITQDKVEQFLKNIAWKSKKEWEKELETFIKNNIENASGAWKDVKENILKWLSPKELTETNFSQSEFANDFQDSNTGKKPEYSDFHVLLWENYIKIPDKEGSSDKQKDFEMMFDKSLNKILEKQSPDFKKINAEIIWNLKTAKNNNERYINLHKLFVLSQANTAISLKWKEWESGKDKEKSPSKNRLHELLNKGREGAKANTEKNEKRNSIAATIEQIEEINAEKAEELEKKLGDIIKKENASIKEYSDLLNEAKEALSNNTGTQKKE